MAMRILLDLLKLFFPRPKPTTPPISDPTPTVGEPVGGRNWYTAKKKP